MIEPTRFRDRTDAGERLAARLRTTSWTEPLVLGLARGGVVVATPVAHALVTPLDVVVARKIGARDQPEFAIGRRRAGRDPPAAGRHPFARPRGG